MVEAGVAQRVGFKAGEMGLRGESISEFDKILPITPNLKEFIDLVVADFYRIQIKISNNNSLEEREVQTYRRACNVLGQLMNYSI